MGGMVYELTKEFRFEASHILPHHDGKCARLHGHSWKLAICVRGPMLHLGGPQKGMLVDFAVLKNLAQPIINEYLDHRHLNDSTGIESPTSEALARWLYDKLRDEMPPGLRDQLYYVRVDETCTSSCRYGGQP